MDPRRALPCLLLMACAIDAASPFRNGRDGPNLIRRTRRIGLNEYLVPPPPPKFHPGRVGRLAPTEAPGYFAQLMSWLNPFNYGSSSQPPAAPLSPPPSPHSEVSYPPSPKFIQHPPPPVSGPPAKIYDASSSLPVYDRPPFPFSNFNNHPGYPPANKAKNCNPCNKVPWMPMQPSELSHSGDAAFVLPPLPPPHLPQHEGYLPPNDHEVAHDAYHAASQEVKAPDFSFLPPLGEGPLIGPLPNPQLYPGAMPPLFKAVDFNHPVQATFDENSEYLHVPSSSVSGNGLFMGNGSFPVIVEPNFNDGHNEQFAYADPSGQSDLRNIHQGYIDSSANNRETGDFHVQNYEQHSDLTSSGTQVSDDNVNPILSTQGLEDTTIHHDSLNSISHQTSFGSSDGIVLDHQPSAVSNNVGFYDITRSHGLLSDSFDNSNQMDRNPPSNYGISDLDQIPNKYEHRYNDLSSSGSVVKDSHASLQSSADESTTKIGDSIHFEESPLLDLTHKGESRTDSTSIPPTSNALDFNESASKTAGATLVSGDELFDTHQDLISTESPFFADHFQTTDSSGFFEKSKIIDSTTQISNSDPHGPKTLQGQTILHVSSPGQAEYLWPSVSPTTSKDAEGEPFLSFTLVNSDVEEEASSQSNSKDTTIARQQGAKRNKQVQVIIPYTSQYTPIPFHPPHGQKVAHTREPDHDNYVSAESRSRVKVDSLPSSSGTSQTWRFTSAILEDITRKSVNTKVNNSIDVHRLQKNIDNWTIQEYSKGTTASTVSPSSINPYLLPSKQIPDEYLTTTEPVDYVEGSHDNNVKTFALAGFSFNDLEHESSSSNRVEGPRIQVIQSGDSRSTEASIHIATSAKDDIIWQGFSVDISPVNKERVYVVTPQPIITTPRSKPVEQKKEKTTKEMERNSKESKLSEMDIKKIKKKTNTFESIEKAYQVLPQAVNNLAVASTGPESVPLWGIMEHEDFASLDDDEHNKEDEESADIPVLYTGHSKVSHARR